jgi:RNA polymerase sigma factor (sigma-70 family)
MQKNIAYSSSGAYTEKNKLLGELITKYQGGNDKALDEILLLNIDTIKGVFKLINYSYFGNLTDHYEDMRQEGLMAVMDVAATYLPIIIKDGKKISVRPLTYIFSKCRSSMTKYVRQMYNKTASVNRLTDDDIDSVQDPSYTDILELMALNEGVSNILRCVSSKERKILEYKYWWGLNNVDTGLLVKLSPHTVAKKLRVAKKKIKNKLPNFRSDYIE